MTKFESLYHTPSNDIGIVQEVYQGVEIWMFQNNMFLCKKWRQNGHFSSFGPLDF